MKDSGRFLVKIPRGLGLINNTHLATARSLGYLVTEAKMVFVVNWLLCSDAYKKFT